MRSMILRSRRRTNKGFNLIEAAIVLGIVGLVVGGIWVAATSVYANLRSKSATDSLLKIAQSVRALYATSNTMGAGAPGDLTAALAQANILPGDALTVTPAATTSANTVNPWSGNIGVGKFNAAGTQFYVTYSNVPSAACVDFVIRNTGTSRDAGMLSVAGAVGTNGVILPVPGAGTALTSGAAFTLVQAQNAAVCNSAAGNAVNISFIFNLKG